ncbi:MAG: glycosyltransferase family 39 protein [Planctomycetes bacterium]|nr:glycosyltransferase family 39 protein [Planctomycetota bacterium]
MAVRSPMSGVIPHARPRPRDISDVPMSYARWSRSWSAIVLLVVGVTTLRLAYVAWVNPYALVEDEAHYWEWSRRLDWSYYSKGPGIALAIRAATMVFGDTEFAVRLPAVVASMVVTLAIACLAVETTGDRRAGFFAAVCTLLAPIFQVSAVLMTIDGPYVAAWAVAAWAAWRALERRSRWAWVVLGTALAVGFLFKYTIVLLVPGLLLYALMRRRRLHLHARWKRWAFSATAVALAGVAPVVIWNAQHDWATVRHLLGHVAMPGGDVSTSDGWWRWDPMWTVVLIASQVAMLGGNMFLALYSTGTAMARRRAEPRAWPGRAFLICCAAPILVFYLAVTLFAPGEANWPMAGFVTLLALCGWGVVEAMDRFRHMMVVWKSLPDKPRPWWGVIRRKPELHRQMAWHATVVIGLVAGTASLRLDWAAPSINWIVSTAAHVAGRVGIGPGQADRVIPLGRMMEAPTVAAEVDRWLEELRASTRREPFVISQHYGRASQLAFYLADRPRVYCSSSLVNGRRTQYDLWSDTDLSNMKHLEGRPAVLVGGSETQWAKVFGRVESIGILAGEHKPDRRAYLGFGYRGFGRED